MPYRVYITAERRDPIDLDRLAAALLAIVGDLDPAVRKRLARRGQRRLDALAKRNEGAA